jgi:hypothetical protein
LVLRWLGRGENISEKGKDVKMAEILSHPVLRTKPDIHYM